jgi:four helix bundle protein
LKIRQFAIEIANELFDIVDELERRKLYRFADQLRGAGMPMPNNIAEGSGSNSTKEFRQFLNMARRSPFENVNILILLKKRNFITKDSLEKLLDQLTIFVDKLRTFKIL